MQKIIHTDGYKYIHPIFNEIEQYFELISSKTPEKALVNPQFDINLKPIADLINKHLGINYTFEYVTKEYSPLAISNPDNTVVVCFSGGKDSYAAAVHYQELGYKVVLYNIVGLNYTYKDEIDGAKALAKRLNLPLHTEKLSYKGFHDWVEHPMKNMIMASMALNFSVQHGFGTKIVVGDFYTMHIDDSVFVKDAGDCVEMWDIYRNLITPIIPNFELLLPNKDMFTAYELILKNPYVLLDTVSCVGPYRYKDYLRMGHEKHYKLRLMPHRCGSCWKCAIEYIYFTDHDVLTYNEGYYKHCLKILRRKIREDTGLLLKHTEDLWEACFNYPIEQSKMKNIKEILPY